jgi:CheY-like chemotaxis protein/class 3 adenylate cyclase/predicted metal-dependent HD superfamily phosphohydrolase
MPENSGRMLVVDDNRINRMVLQRALTQQGYDVTTTENGRQALERLRAEPFDVVLLDILMPEMDGYETLAHIKQDPSLHHIPVIMISAVEEMDSVVRCIEMGATDYLPKPFNPALLRARINTSLAEKRLRDLEREYLEQVGYVADAAAAVQAARFDPASLDGVAAREDALGQLARVFQHMAREVHLREQRLKQQIQQMHLDVEEMRKALVEPLSVYLPMDRRQALVRGELLADRATGSALFADISGFTPLTAALAQELGLQRGAEELTRLLNDVYGVLIAEVHRFGGSVIGFSGDAITCWLDGDSGLRAVAAALAMQGAMAPFASVQTPGGTAVSLAVKVAVVAGQVRRFLVGDPSIQNLEVIAGQTLDRLAEAEHQANRGEVVVQAGVAEGEADKLVVAEWRGGAEAGDRVAVVSSLTAPVPARPWPELPPNCLPDEQCRPWLLPGVYRRLCTGSRQFLAELRPAVALFLRFTGIEYDQDATAGDRLDAFVRWVQGIVERYEGSLIQLTIGDKGSYLYLAFGAPAAHADDELRAVQAAVALQSPPPELGYIAGIQIGIAKGRMRTGAYGGTTQRTYGVLGDRTNLAARLMQAAAEGILCDDAVFQAAQEHVAFQALPPIRVKGKAEPVPVYRPTGDKPPTRQSEAAIQALIDRLAPAEQLTLKVASVAGGTFSAALLAGIFPDDADKPHLPEHLQTLERLQLILQDSPEPTYAFRNTAVQALAYDSLLFAQRRHLHRLAADWYERTFEDRSPFYAALAHHWRQAEEPAKAIEYLEQAGRQAMRAGAFEEAERCFQESLELSAQSAVLSEGFYDRSTADFEGARLYALDRLAKELPAELTYHSPAHTRDEVLPAAQRLAAMIGVPEADVHLLETAAAYHDLGYTRQRQEHERMGSELTAEVLPRFGFSPAQIAAIQGMIMATQLPQSPRTLLEEILADADLDVLGRDDFLERNRDLRDELAASGTQIGDERWYSSQLQMLRSHRYWTAAARNLRAAGKQKNLEQIQALLAQAGHAPPDPDVEPGESHGIPQKRDRVIE